MGIPSLRDSLALLALSSLANYGALFLLPLYFQEARGQSALHAGFLLVAQGAGSLLSRGVAGKLTDRIGPRPVVLSGFLVVLLGTLPLLWLDKGTGMVVIVATLIVRGFGTGAVVIPLMASSYRDLQSTQVSHGSVLVRVAMQLGGAFGTAALAVILHLGLHGSTGSNAYAQGFAWCAGFAALAVLWTLRLPAGPIRLPAEA
jgi:MFS family permease